MQILPRGSQTKNKPNLWCRYRDDIFDLWTQGQSKLIDFTEFINSLYPTIKFTLVYSPTSLNVLDLTLNLVEGYIQTDIYSKPTDNHIYLLRKKAHPAHCTKAIPFGIATRVKSRVVAMVQWLAHLTCNPGNAGSIPTHGIYVFSFKMDQSVFRTGS